MRNFLGECYRIEQLAAKVYTRFANNSKYSRTLRALFRDMADDELEHARIIDLVMQTPTQDLDAKASFSSEQVDEMLRLTKAMLVSAEHADMTEEQAIQLALQVEDQLVQAHANNALIPGNPMLADFFTNLASYDRDHVNKLRSYAVS